MDSDLIILFHQECDAGVAGVTEQRRRCAVEKELELEFGRCLRQCTITWKTGKC